MNSFRKLLLIGLAALVMVTGALAAIPQTPTPYPTDYRVIGGLTAAGGSGVTGYKVVFYKTLGTVDYADGYSYALSDGNGKFNINVHDDLRLLPLAAGDYYLGVVKQLASDGKYYGIDGTKLTILPQDVTNGYKIVDPSVFGTLAQDKGITDPGGLVPPAGTVPLTITRDSTNTNILVSWDAAQFQQPQIYVYTGDGSGTYNDVITNWTKIADKGALIGSPTGFTYTEGQLKHANQVGQGAGEAYYKALWSTTDPTATDPATAKTYFSECWAAGKFNVTVAGAGTNAYKYSFVSVPFASVDPSADVVFGNQVPEGSSSSVATELWGWTGTAFNNEMYLDATTHKWAAINGFAAVTVAPTACYVFRTKPGSSDKVVTVLGNVVYDAGATTVGANLYSFLADPYPISVSLATSRLVIGAIKATSSGYADQLWGWTGTAFGQQVYYNTNNGWTPVGTYAAITTLKPGSGYVYRRYTLGGFSWGFNPY